MSDRRRARPPAARGAPGAEPKGMPEAVEPDTVHDFRLAGETLRFETNDPRVLALAAALFDRYGPPPGEGSGQPLVLRVVVDPNAPRARQPDPVSETPVFRMQRHLFTVSLGTRDGGAADLDRGVAFAVVGPALVEAGWPLQWHVMSALALGMLGPARGYLPLHAACVVRDGRSVLVHAPSGAGKSTLSYAAVRRGFRFVSDDSLHVGGRPEPRVWGIPWQAQLLTDTARFFPELAASEPRRQANGEWKIDADPERLRPGAIAPSAPLGPVVLLRRRPGPTAIERLSDAEAFEQLEVAWPFPVGWTRAHEGLRRTVVAQGVYRFESGADPDRMVDALDAFLSERSS